MLVVSRDISESVIISPDPLLDPNTTIAELFNSGPILITVTDIQHNRVRIGIQAPAQINIVRSELTNIQ